jgi:hypothetical protein
MSRRGRVSPNARDVTKAAALYGESLDAAADAARWRAANESASKLVADALDASDNLRQVSEALQTTGGHTRAFRFMLAPPLSQDQFALHCLAWSKSSEKSGSKLDVGVADAVSAALSRRFDAALTPWLSAKRDPRPDELRNLRVAATALMAFQVMGTNSRNVGSVTQEESVIAILKTDGWTKIPLAEIDKQGLLKRKQFAHKVKCATDTEPQEVDIACGLSDTVVLAMECKVSNDRTNSIKRINDVLKKAKAWKDHWGSFVKTAALLQGVFKASDVDRLTAADIEVYWSHDLAKFVSRLNKR